LEKGKYSRNICLWAEMKREKMCIFWKDMSNWENDSAYKSVQSAGCDSPGSDSSPGEKSTAARSVWARREGTPEMEAREGDMRCWAQRHGCELPALP